MEQNLRFHQVVITPEDHTCLHTVLTYALSELRKKQEDHTERDGPELTYFEDLVLQQAEQLGRWKDYVSQSLYKCWRELPEGDHLRHSYRDQVWTWDDQDLANIPEDRRISPEELREIVDCLVVDDE